MIEIAFQGLMTNINFDISNNKAVFDAAFKYGFDKLNTYQGTANKLSGVKTMSGHDNHGHLGFSVNPINVSNL